MFLAPPFRSFPTCRLMGAADSLAVMPLIVVCRVASPRSTAGATEVLPVIRCEGAYVAASRDDDPETLMARALIAAKSALDRQAKQLEA